MSIHFLSVDLQNDFTTEGGAHYQPRRCVPFISHTLIPFIREHGYTIAEIISDYRATPPEPDSQVCVPGEWGYQSLIPPDIKHASVWVKASPSPAWIRAGGGHAEQRPGVPYPDPHALSAWLVDTIGPPTPDAAVVLIGLVLEVCVLSTIQELHHRGYRVKVLSEGVDTSSGDEGQKHLLFDMLFPFWGSAISWHDVQKAGR